MPGKEVYNHHIFTIDQYICNTANDKSSHSTITYLVSLLDVLSILSDKVAHVVPTEDRSFWLLVALYNGKVVNYLQYYPMYCTCMICIHKFIYLPASYKIFPMAALFSTYRNFHLYTYKT